MRYLICREAVRDFVLELSKKRRGGKFTRVSKEFLERTEAHVEKWISEEFHCHPSIGKTIK